MSAPSSLVRPAHHRSPRAAADLSTPLHRLPRFLWKRGLNSIETDLAVHLILDTDIGSDVDDALTLIAGSTELISDGITTVCGDTARRASLTCRHPRLAGKDIGLTMAAGLRNARSGRAVWWTGHESVLGPDLGDEAVDAEAIKYTEPAFTVARKARLAPSDDD